MREGTERLGEGLLGDSCAYVGRELVADDLLLEQRAHDDRRGARVLEAPYGVEVVGERRGARHERDAEG